MRFEPFELERIQSLWEHQVEINLTESGVLPLTLGELIADPKDRPFLFENELGYTQTNGTLELRERIASMYPGATTDNILVTNGGAEANFIAAWNLLLESGMKGELIMLLPNYMQLHGVWKNLGGQVRSFHLRMSGNRWAPDIEELKSMITSDTIAIAICTPNNPTGAILEESELRAIAEVAEDNGLWLLSDEIYRGAELSEQMSPSAYGMTERTLVTSSLSKVYGLPGLRVGWVASPSESRIADLWAFTDYTSICPSALSDYLATLALEPEFRSMLVERARSHVSANWGIMKEWLDSHATLFDYVPPQAASICFPRYNLEIGSIELVERLRVEKSVLIVPGAHFGMEHHLRIGFGYEEEKLREGLSRFSDLLSTLS